MNKKIIIIFMSAIMALGFSGCGSISIPTISAVPENSSVSEVNQSSVEESLNSAKITSISVGSAKQLSIKQGTYTYKHIDITGSNLENSAKEIEFINQNSQVATIEIDDNISGNSIGYRINAVSAGTTTIYAQTKDGKLKTGEITVTVTANESSEEQSSEPEVSKQESSKQEVSKEESSKTEISSKPEVSEQESSTVEISVEESSKSISTGITTGQRNALKSAQSYIEYMAFSYSGLIEQLEYEGYSHSDAVFAADNCGADWNEEAIEDAQSYIEYMAFSYSGLIEQLEYGGFTDEQAKYGADNCGANWNEEAAESAESYLKYMSFSRDELIDQLEYEGFTYEQAVYGVEANGY